MIISRGGIYDNTRVMILGGKRMGISRKFWPEFMIGALNLTPPLHFAYIACHPHHVSRHKMKKKKEVLDQNLISALAHNTFAWR